MPSPSRSLAVQGLRKDVGSLLRRWRRRDTGTAAPAADRAIVSDYLAAHHVRKLQIGAGETELPGWLCTDLNPRQPTTMRLDVTEPFPIPGESIDYIVAEHVIEHVTHPQGHAMLRECLRILRPGAVIRVATPDLDRLVRMYLGEAGEAGEAYKRWSLDRHLSRPPRDHAAFVLNHHVRAWGHTFMYDEAVLVEAMSTAGFEQVTRRGFDESPHEELRGIEEHGARGGARRRAAVRFETMVVEGQKPVS